jgi:hypothetical protein
VGVGDGVEVATGRVVGVAVGVELLVVTACDVPQAARKHRQKATNTSKHRFIRNLSFFSSC